MSVGFFNFISIHRELRVNTFYGREKELLIAFKNLLKTHFNKAPHFLSLTAYVIGIPSLKNNIDCSQEASIYYKVNKIDRIAISVSYTHLRAHETPEQLGLPGVV